MQDMRRIPVDFGESPVHGTGIEVRGVNSIGEEFARGCESEIDEALTLGHEVTHEIRTVVVSVFA